jgi:hypothetical protein
VGLLDLYPGKVLPVLAVSLTDFYQQRVRAGSVAQQSVDADVISASVDDGSLNGRVILPLVDGWANFTDLVVRSMPGSYNLRFTFLSRTASSTVLDRTLSLKLGDCPAGMGFDAHLVSCGMHILRCCLVHRRKPGHACLHDVSSTVTCGLLV